MTQVPALLRDMPTLARHRAVLTPATYDRDGKEVVDWSIDVHRGTRLLPEAVCRDVVAEVARASEPAGRETAAKLGRVLVGSYPAREIHDADVYSRAIASVFETVPADIGREAVDRITRTLRFLPTRAEVHAACTRLVAERQWARRVAEAHLKEHFRRQRETEDEERIAAERKAFRAQWGEAWDAWMAIPLMGRPPFTEFRESWQQERA